MASRAFPYKNVIVVGATGSGKSTLAEQLAQKFGLQFIELDAIHWLPEWQQAADRAAHGEYLENGRISGERRRKGLKPETKFRPDTTKG